MTDRNPNHRQTASWKRWLGGTGAVLVVSIGICEILGWPFLAAPIQTELSKVLDRKVSLSADPGQPPRLRIHFLGHLRIQAPYLEVGAPPWSKAPHMILARDVKLSMRWIDLWRISRGEPIHIHDLGAQQLDVQVQRLADGRASWQFGSKTQKPDNDAKPVAIPTFDHLEVVAGTVSYDDALIDAKFDGKYSLVDGSSVLTKSGSGDSAAGDAASGAASGNATMPVAKTAATEAASAASVASASSNISAKAASSASTATATAADTAASGPPNGLRFSGSGTYKNQPMRIDLDTNGVLSLLGTDASRIALPLTLDARIGGAQMKFKGTATDVAKLTGLKGRFSVAGSSLAAAGAPLKVTLPTTGPFKLEGLIAKEGQVWNTVVETATIGSSHLNASLTYDARPKIPVLSGTLSGSKLALVDLGPSIGGSPKTDDAGTKAEAKKKAPDKVIPDKEFNLPSLRAMNANILFDIKDFDLGTSVLEPLRPMRTHLVLNGGVLTLDNIDARTADGRLSGMIQLDGSKSTAHWITNLRWNDVQLDKWLNQKRAADKPPYLSGKLDGQVRLEGEGNSTAAILSSLRGGLRTQVFNGKISHLAVEAAGLDVAQALGEFVKGDDPLPIRCSIIDLTADKGVLTPKVMVIDTSDSTLFVNGTVSLATEKFDLRVVTAPNDFTIASLRSPLLVGGNFGDPSVSLEKGPLAAKIGSSILLGLLNPLAAIIPLFDFGSDKKADKGNDACLSLSKRIAGKVSLPPPSAIPARAPVSPATK